MKFNLAILFISAIINDCHCKLEKKTKKDNFEFFRTVDGDGDGLIRDNEIRDFVKDIGTHAFDEKQEIENGVQLILENVDFNADKVLSLGDLNKYWKRLGELLTVEEAAKWAEHAVQIPQLGEIFRVNSVAGHDIPSLLTNSKEMKELGIPPLHQRALKRAISMKLMGLGRAPTPPESFTWSSASCNAIVLRWTKPLDDGGIPVHKFVLERQSSLPGKNKIWEKVADGMELFYRDNDVDLTQMYSYRLEAWNALGRSQVLLVEDAHLTSCLSPFSASGWSMFASPIFAVQENPTLLQFFISIICLFFLYSKQGPILKAFGVEVNRTDISIGPTSKEVYESDSESPRKRILAKENNVEVGKEVKSVPIDRCNYCCRKFGTTLFRHHCSRCTAVFCNRDGYTPHFVLTDCGIPGKCVCAKCIREESATTNNVPAHVKENAEIRHRVARQPELASEAEAPLSQRNGADLWRKMRLLVKASNGFRSPPLLLSSLNSRSEDESSDSGSRSSRNTSPRPGVRLSPRRLLGKNK